MGGIGGWGQCLIVISTGTSINMGYIPLVNCRWWVQCELLVTIQDDGGMMDGHGSSKEMRL